jgi:tetratricopeptide (TPR) repeat protein
VDEYAKPHGLPGIAVLEAELALLYIRTGDLDASNRHSGRALRLARQNGLTQLEGAIRYGQFIPMTLTGQYDRALRYLDHGCRIFETLGHADGLVFGEWGRGWTYEEQGDYPTATEHFRRSLELGRDDASALYLSFPLEGMAAVHHRKGDDATAAAVFGASDAIRSGARSRRPAYLPGARLIPVIKDRLGDEAWTRAHERGLTLSIDEAVDLALG